MAEGGCNLEPLFWGVTMRFLRTRAQRFILAAFILLLALSSWFYVKVSNYYNAERVLAAPVYIDVTEGMGAKSLAKLLAKSGAGPWELGNTLSMRLYGKPSGFKAGHYSFAGTMTLRQMLSDIYAGRVSMVDVTFPEGYTLRQMAPILEAAGVTGAAGFIAVATDPATPRRFDLPGDSLEGFLFPDTYRFARGLKPLKVVEAMVGRFKVVAKELGFIGRGDLYRTVILASIIEKETGKGEERPLIASVFENRLKIGMTLGSDPTVIYGIPDFDGNLRKVDLLRDAPYNTYVRKGLPPGPIANPGKESLQAVLNPAKTKYLYFVGKGDGSHYFSTSLAEHNRAVSKYQLKGKK